MVKERRVFNRLPEYLQTDQNSRDMYITDDVMFEPERAGLISGYIGDTSMMTEEDLTRQPPIMEATAERQKRQLSLGAVLVDPDTGNRFGGAFYSDLVGQISSNGGITTDPNRLFETSFYAWTPPIDYDKHINFTRYYWTGAGTAEINGEYITKEAQGSQTVLHEVVNSVFVTRYVTISPTAPTAPAINDLWENTNTPNRQIFKWNGNGWVGINYRVVSDIPDSSETYLNGDYCYVTRTGPEFNRPLMWRFSTDAGRWLSQPVVVGPTPDNPTEGMIWEDSSAVPNRVFFIYKDGAFVTMNWTNANGPSGSPADGTYLYDNREISSVTDSWSAQNFWRHFNDLSPADRSNLQSADQATRPIVEFWGGIKSPSGDFRDYRNDMPIFETYSYELGNEQVEYTGHDTTLFQYRVGSGVDDAVLGFPLVYSQSGEFQYELTLETDEIEQATGFRYYVDEFTGLAHSIWAKSQSITMQEIDSDGLADLPKSLTSNANHVTTTIASRSLLLPHMAGIIAAQEDIEGNQYGYNNYRWTSKNPTIGASLIDCENTLLRTMATLQTSELDIPTVIRKMSSDYNRVMFKFVNRLNYLWNALSIANPVDQLTVTPAEATDAILTELFIGRNEQFPYYYSDMGEYLETQISAGSPMVINSTPRPIFIPSSAARIGAAPSYKPTSFVDADGVTRLRGHDGHTIVSFGDERDLVWLEFQNRMFAAVPSYYKDEITGFSSRHNTTNFFLKNFYGNTTPTITSTVDMVVDDYTTVVSPTMGMTVLDTGRGVLATYNGNKFNTSATVRDGDVIANRDDGEYYFNNGYGTILVDRHERPYNFDYSIDEYKQILRREFERWGVSQDVDFITNDQYDETDPFTWNYRSAGVEGHYMGIYARVYNSVRPHSHPWEVVGYHSEPDWWQTEYPPTSIAGDNTPRYANTHPMWDDFKNGIYNPLNGASSDQFVMVGPTPVDHQGELLDPIAAGVVDQTKLVPNRLDDSWLYGDGAPIEQDFVNSANYAFAVALLGYLMKPVRFVDTIWSELYINIGETGTHPLWNAPHVVNRDTLNRPSLDNLPVHLELVDGKTTQRNGLNAWISEYVRLLGNDVTDRFGNIIRNTEISLGWACSGFINQERTVVKTLSGIKIPYEDVHTILHRSRPVQNYFGSGVMVTRDGDGYRVFGYNLFDPYFTIDVPVSPIVGGQIELREDLVAEQNQHAFTTTEFRLPRNVMTGDTATLGVLINGLRMRPQHITVTGSNTFEIEDIINISAGDIVTPVVMTTQSNPSTRVKQFQVDGVSFPYIDQGLGYTQKIEYGHYFDTAPDVINFMLGYGRQLAKQGWVFDDEVAPGTTRDWLYGAKGFATWVLNTGRVWQNKTTAVDEEFVYSPFSKVATFQSNFGQVLNVEAVQNGVYGVLDKDANPIDPDTVFTSRIGNQLTLKASGDEIYGVRMSVAIDQHVVFFSNTTKFNDLIYDPVSALAQTTLRLDAYRSHDWNGRLEADGFIINQDEILPNFEKQAKDFTRYYDRVDTLDDPVKRDQSRELYGWYPNEEYTSSDGKKTPMMGAIGADDRSQFDYHRGMIQSKGTIRSLTAFSRGTRGGRDSVAMNEDWAWRWSDFGDLRLDTVRFTVNKNEYRERVQVIAFNEEPDPTNNILQIPTFYRSNPDDGRWVIPPISGDDGLCCHYTLPMSPSGKFDTTTTKMSVSFTPSVGETSTNLFHYDPATSLRLNDPLALCNVEYIGELDPARYTDGDGVDYSNGIQWGPNQVGHYWWDKSRLNYVDYHSLLPDYELAAREWGKQAYFSATVVRVDNYVTVTTLSPYDGTVVPHNLSTGDVVEISGAEQDDYNTEIVVTVTGPYEFEYEIQTIPESPATGNIKVQAGFVDVYEWVKSPVTPSGWANYVSDSDTTLNAPTGVPINGDDTSYVSDIQMDQYGTPTTYYYFWVKGNVQTGSKSLTADDVADRLDSPTQTNTPWTAVVDATHLLTFVGGERVVDDYEVDVIVDKRSLDYHTEWLLISEGDQFNSIPLVVKNKVIDSLIGQDEMGNTVPYSLLTETEKYGTGEFPPQSIFKDKAQALDVFTTTLNRMLRSTNTNTVQNINELFPLADEGVYWKRTEYRVPDYADQTVFDVVATNVVRDDRLAVGRYAIGDLVNVVNTTNIDQWDGSDVDSTYVVDDNNSFTEVGIGKRAVELFFDSTTDADVMRTAINNAYDLLSKQDQNELIFATLYEMMRQHPYADWFMKTSYVTMQLFDTAGQFPYLRSNEPEAIISAALDSKPYRTKLRANVFTYDMDEDEQIEVGMDEAPGYKVTLSFDRLSCVMDDSSGWDMISWDTNRNGWNNPIWDWADQGLSEYFTVVQFSGIPNQTVYEFDVSHNPTLYAHRLLATNFGEEILLSDMDITVDINTTQTSIQLVFSDPLDSNIEITVQQASGFYDGETPSLGDSLKDTSFSPVATTFKHHVIRMMEMGIDTPFPSMESCYLDPPESPEERLPTDTSDSVSICVTTDWTPAYAGWGATPWDTTEWDRSPSSVGSRVFYSSVGGQQIIPPGTVIFVTSEDVIVTNTNYVTRSEIHHVAQINHNGNPLTEGVDYNILPESPWVAEFPPRADIYFLADGLSTTYDISSSAPYGIDSVYINSSKQTLNVDYTIVGSAVQFVQPSPMVISVYSTTVGKYLSASGGENVFSTGQSGSGVSKTGVFVFYNNTVLDPSDYSINVANGNVDATVPAQVGDDVVVFSFGNAASNSNDLFAIHDFVGNGTTTTFEPGMNANIQTAWVFIDGVYQILGSSYTMPSYGVLEFNTPPTTGAKIQIRVMNPSEFITHYQQHEVITASGSIIDSIPGILDTNPDHYLIMVGSVPQNGYSTGGAGDYTLQSGPTTQIVWTVAPPVGMRITVRYIKQVEIDQTLMVRVIPAENDTVKFIQNETLQTGDTITFMYDQFPIDPNAAPTVTMSPTNYDIDYNRLILQNPVLNGYIYITYDKNRREQNPHSLIVRMPIVVDRAEPDHLIWDDALGDETHRATGLRVLNTTNKKIYQWNGSGWDNMGITLAPMDQILSLQDQQILEYDGAVITTVYETGDPYSMPPVLPYPVFGRGITSATYALGQLPNAAVDFPEAYQIMQHLGSG